MMLELIAIGNSSRQLVLQPLSAPLQLPRLQPPPMISLTSTPHAATHTTVANKINNASPVGPQPGLVAAASNGSPAKQPAAEREHKGPVPPA
jgi:hypothetical protein